MGDTTPSSGTTTNPTSIIVQQDNSPFPTAVILDETNFSLWSQLMEMRIGARNKVGYLTGEVKKPEQTDLGYAIWITENHKVKSWLIDSMSPTLMQRFIMLSMTKEIWEAVAKTFYDGSDETRLFELNKKSFTTMQSGRPLSTYYNELVAIFQEIDHRTNTQDRSVKGILQMHSMMARLRDPKLDLENAYAYVRREAQQRQTMGSARLIPESSTMAVHCSSSVKGRTNQSSGILPLWRGRYNGIWGAVAAPPLQWDEGRCGGLDAT
ncbi:hypothetical protein KY284_015644 [Solanum tuberosum]|nr:hypothetical protein KY284_015644 [Solanum tuberosum]